MTPVEWAMRPLKRYATFSGRAPRAEWWWFFLFMLIIYVVLAFVLVGSIGGFLAASQGEPSVGMLGGLGGAMLFLALFWLALIVPTIAVQMRRLHDINRSGWWVGGFYLLYAVYSWVTMSATFSAAAGAVPTEGSMSTILAAGVIGLLLFIYSIVLLVFYCLPGTKGENRYGPDPYGPQNLDEVFA